MPEPVKWIIAGGIAGVIGAAIWAGISYATGVEIGWIAWGVGVLVGFGVRLGSPNSYGAGPGIAAAVIALVSLALGKCLTIYAVVSKELGVQLGPSEIVQAMPQTLGPMDILFAGLAVFSAFKLGGAMEDGE